MTAATKELVPPKRILVNGQRIRLRWRQQIICSFLAANIGALIICRAEPGDPLPAVHAAMAVHGQFQQVTHGPSVRARLTRQARVFPSVGWRAAVIWLRRAFSAAT